MEQTENKATESAFARVNKLTYRAIDSKFY